jgi:hypothetical protein
MLEKIEQQFPDVERVIAGHGPITSYKILEERRAFLEDLMREVKECHSEGMTLEQMEKRVTLEKYSHLWGAEYWRSTLIQSALDELK